MAAVRDDDARPRRGDAAGRASPMGSCGKCARRRHPRHRAIPRRLQPTREGTPSGRAGFPAALEAGDPRKESAASARWAGYRARIDGRASS